MPNFINEPDDRTLLQEQVHDYPNEFAFVQGVKAFNKGIYGIPGSMEEDFYKEWQRGWNHAYLRCWITQRGVERSIRNKRSRRKT